jgi:hypothetical protein
VETEKEKSNVLSNIHHREQTNGAANIHRREQMNETTHIHNQEQLNGATTSSPSPTPVAVLDSVATLNIGYFDFHCIYFFFSHVLTVLLYAP